MCECTRACVCAQCVSVHVYVCVTRLCLLASTYFACVSVSTTIALDRKGALDCVNYTFVVSLEKATLPPKGRGCVVKNLITSHEFLCIDSIV